jgi:carboxymethylenebutenolidase
MRDVARRFAKEGYAGLAVDLFTGRNRAICMARYMTGMLLGSVNRYGIDDLKSALTYLAKHESIDAQKLGAIGFCMGGGFAIAWACTDSRLKAIAPFYGVNPRPLSVVGRLCPVVGSYPERDFTARSGRVLEAALTEKGIAHDIKTYPGARHSFFNDTRASSYDKAAADDSWQRVLAFFGERLH